MSRAGKNKKLMIFLLIALVIAGVLGAVHGIGVAQGEGWGGRLIRVR